MNAIERNRKIYQDTGITVTDLPAQQEETKMLNWYELPGALDDIENNPIFLEKMALDDEPAHEQSRKKHRCGRSDCAWVRKRNYKKRMVRLFLSINPAMDYSQLCGSECSGGIYLCIPNYNDGDFYDPRKTYSFNPYTRVFLSPRGDLRKYRGAVVPCRTSFALRFKNKDAARITNRKLRHLAFDETIPRSYSYCKKNYGPPIDRIW